jgi:hypothetical protein
VNSGDPDAARAELRRRHADLRSGAVRPNAPAWSPYLGIAVAAASLSDPELALDAAESMLDGSATQSYLLWRPVFREVRVLPRFKDVMTERGFVAYWREHGWGDFCRPLAGDDFECR